MSFICHASYGDINFSVSFFKKWIITAGLPPAPGSLKEWSSEWRHPHESLACDQTVNIIRWTDRKVHVISQVWLVQAHGRGLKGSPLITRNLCPSPRQTKSKSLTVGIAGTIISVFYLILANFSFCSICNFFCLTSRRFLCDNNKLIKCYLAATTLNSFLKRVFILGTMRLSMLMFENLWASRWRDWLYPKEWQ